MTSICHHVYILYKTHKTGSFVLSILAIVDKIVVTNSDVSRPTFLITVYTYRSNQILIELLNCHDNLSIHQHSVLPLKHQEDVSGFGHNASPPTSSCVIRMMASSW